MAIRKSSSAFTLAVLGVLCGTAMLAIFLGSRLVAYDMVRRMARQDPRLFVVPQTLPVVAASSGAGITLSRFGFTFEAPWQDLDRIEDHKSLAVIFFKSGRSVAVIDPKQQVDRIKMVRDQAAKDGQNPQDSFAPETLASNYQFVNTAFSMTPARVSLLMAGKDMMKDSILLGIKGAEIVYTETGLYAVKVHGWQGFQKGDPAQQVTTILDLFDEQDHELRLKISTRNLATAPITQGDLNRILLTVQADAARK